MTRLGSKPALRTHPRLSLNLLDPLRLNSLIPFPSWSTTSRVIRFKPSPSLLFRIRGCRARAQNDFTSSSLPTPPNLAVFWEQGGGRKPGQLKNGNLWLGLYYDSLIDALHSPAKIQLFEGGWHMFFKAQISNCPVHGLKPKVRIELNRTFVRFKEFKAHVRLSSVAH